jgi:chromosome segregation ATPase
VSEIDEAVEATQKELERVRAELAHALEARVGERLRALEAERDRVRSEADALEAANAEASRRIAELEAKEAEGLTELKRLTG